MNLVIKGNWRYSGPGEPNNKKPQKANDGGRYIDTTDAQPILKMYEQKL